MDTIESALDQISSLLEKFNNLPAISAVVVGCVIIGYIFKLLPKFPNQAIPVVVILTGAVLYSLIAGANNEWTLRVWIVRNVIMGLVAGFVAWVLHNTLLKKLEEKFGLFQEPKDPPTPTPTA